MKPSGLTNEFIRNFIRQDEPVSDEEKERQEIELSAMKTAAEKFAESYTGLPLKSEEGDCLDDYEDVTFAILAIISDLNENRIANLDRATYSNKTVECILGMHSRNLL